MQLYSRADFSGSEDRLTRNARSKDRLSRDEAASKDSRDRERAGSNQSVQKLPLIGEQKAYYLSMRELPYHQLDSHTSVTNNPLASNESYNQPLGSNESREMEKGERWEPTLVLHDASRTQFASQSERDDSVEPPIKDDPQE